MRTWNASVPAWMFGIALIILAGCLAWCAYLTLELRKSATSKQLSDEIAQVNREIPANVIVCKDGPPIGTCIKPAELDSYFAGRATSVGSDGQMLAAIRHDLSRLTAEQDKLRADLAELDYAVTSVKYH